MQGPHSFDFHYFDDPQALGYRGYHRRLPGDLTIRPWEIAAEVCAAEKIGSAIDLGCAKGFLVEALIARGINAVGYDISEYALAFAVGFPCFKRDIRDGIPERADAIIALGVLMYLQEAELTECLKEIRRACKKMLICSNFYEGDRQVVPDPFRNITRSKDWWRSQVEMAGFRLVGEEHHFDLYAPSVD